MAQKARGHLSLRPKVEDLDRLARRARYFDQPKTALAERYVAEGLAMDEHPGIHFVDGAMGRRPAVVETGLDVWEVVETVQDNDGSVADAADYLSIEPRLVEIAMRYYGSRRSEIDDWINRLHDMAEEEYARWRRGQDAATGS
jgi:uncharacterized protein (DUF433 family)